MQIDIKLMHISNDYLNNPEELQRLQTQFDALFCVLNFASSILAAFFLVQIERNINKIEHFNGMQRCCERCDELRRRQHKNSKMTEKL